ncbi:unnamed protein product, partial [Notodromas monacha]
ALTTHPSNESELQLFRVLQRANLLSYYDTFISKGGDDVQQLCDSGQEEFLEIMDLVGMAAKPLHVRRLQKTLREWLQNPDRVAFMIFAELYKAEFVVPGDQSYLYYRSNQGRAQAGQPPCIHT